MKELQGKRIFIIEDDLMNMTVYTVTLRRSGATVIEDFKNTRSVDALSYNLPIDAILLDLMLRYRINGYEIFEQLQSDPRFAHIPVIVVSAADPGIEIPKAKARGLAGFIGKPIDPIKFPQQIAACIDGESVWYAQQGPWED
jgi:CheY-like chemotaxis protein